MTFIDPSIKKVFNTLVDNDDLINNLKKNNYLITKKSLYNEYDAEKVADMELSIYTNNVNTLYNLAQILLDNSDTIKENEVWYLLSNNIAWDEIAYALGVNPKEMSSDTYKLIMYTYKYCVVSSFFQNNRDKFIPEADFYRMEENPAASAFYDAIMKEFDKMDTIIAKCAEYMSYDEIPYDLINYLTQLCGWEKKDILADEDTEKYFRELAKNIIDIYRIKGTNYSYELFFNFLGFNIEVKEYYFDRRLYYSTSLGNEETDEDDDSTYEYYLTINNPSDNKLQNLGISEIVSEADITEQYSLKEFDELCDTYGVAAVLGYSPIYPVYDSEGNIIEYKEYTGKVYKYFKTNAIYYTISLAKSNPSEKQIEAVTKYLDFLTPSYVMRKLKIKTYEYNDSETIAFDGDGSEESDIYGNYSEFQMLDGEDWQSHYANQYVTNINNYNKVFTGEYENDEPVYANYLNSIGTNKFRLPLEHKSIAKSTSRYLNGGTGTPYPSSRRLKYYILHTLNNQETDDWGLENVVITPYYTVPPYIGSGSYLNLQTSWLKKTTNVNLTGGDGSGGEKCVKTQIRDAELRTPIDYVTNKTISEFLQESSFNELSIGETFAKYLTKVRTIKYGFKSIYSNAYEAYLYEINQKEIHLCNINCDINAFKNEIIAKSFETYQNNKAQFESEIFKDLDIKAYYKNDIIKSLNFGSYVLSYSGTLTDGYLYIYRYGYLPYPVKKDEEQYENTYLNYIKSFDYDLVEVYNDKTLLNANFVTKSDISEVYEYLEGAREAMIEAATNQAVEKWYSLDYVLNKMFFVANEGKYYKPIKKTISTGKCLEIYPSGKTHVFNTMSEATDYFTKYPNEKVNNAEFYITQDKKLYNFKYKNRTIGKLIYSLADEQLYYIHGASKQDIKKIDNFFGCLNISESNNAYSAYIDKYDQYWKGYDEAADSEDFLFYNSEHKISWENLNVSDKYITRPVEYETNKDFEQDELNFKKEYTEADDKNKFKIINGAIKYYNTYGQRIVDEISEKTIDCYTNYEHINWAIDSYTNGKHAGGLLSIIENCIKDLTGETHTNEFKYYGKTSDFFQDYYRMIVLGNLSKISIPKDILSVLVNKEYDNITESDITDKIKESIKKYYNQAVLQCGDILNNISKDRIYYTKIGNWKDLIQSDIVKWEVLPKNSDNEPDYIKVYENPLANNIYGEAKKQVIDDCYYFNTKTNFLTNIVVAKKSLEEKYGEFLNYNVNRELLGKDCYSLDALNTEINFINSYTYEYMKISGAAKITINNFYFVRDNVYNYYIPYSLNYGLGQYSKDYYNEHRDIYSEFTELFDLFYAFAQPDSTRTKKEIDDYLKLYYYKKLTDLYREAPLNDKLPIGLQNVNKKPMNIYPKLAETFNGKAGKFSNSSTLLSSFNQKGNNYNNLKLSFFKLKTNYSNDYKTLYFNFYTTKESFIKAFGYDFNRYYKYLDLKNLTASKIKKLNIEIEEMYKKQFACIRPHFFYKKDYTQNSNWKKNRNNFEVDFSTAEVDNVDSNYKSITDNDGYVINADGNRIYEESLIQERLAESKYLIITASLSTPTTTQKTAVFGDYPEELDCINGFITIKKIVQKFNDSYISKSYYNDWIEKNAEKEPTEYNSFGDDRSVEIFYTNKAVEDYEDYYKGVSETRKHEDSYPQFDKYNKVLTISGEYVDFDNTKTFLDQNIEPDYKKYTGDVILDANNNVAKQVRFTTDKGEVVTVDSDIEFYYDNKGNLVCSVAPGVVSSGNIVSLRLLYKILYVAIKYIKIHSEAYFQNKFVVGQQFKKFKSIKTLFKNNLKPYILTILKKLSFKFVQKIKKAKLKSGYNFNFRIKAIGQISLKNYYNYQLKLKNIKSKAKFFIYNTFNGFNFNKILIKVLAGIKSNLKAGFWFYSKLSFEQKIKKVILRLGRNIKSVLGVKSSIKKALHNIGQQINKSKSFKTIILNDFYEHLYRLYNIKLKMFYVSLNIAKEGYIYSDEEATNYPWFIYYNYNLENKEKSSFTASKNTPYYNYNLENKKISSNFTASAGECSIQKSETTV